MNIKNLVEMIKHNGLLSSVSQLEKLYQAAIENEQKLAELEAHLAALAAELNVVEAIHNNAVFITDDHYEQCPLEVQKIIRSLAVMQIPAYKSFLAEVRAHGVDIAIAELNKLAQRSEKEAPIAAEHHRSAALYLQLFAAQLRKGVQS
ncbi:hypothetical protein ACLO7L_15190 [Enterobacter hormaechei]|uniref:hypothetical protein n=1 Tax=Enterobacter hormaechei TaxID=158836 RepID=UPI0021139C5C|nr:hypothetical protein [Enterobacter hormaechei]EKU4498602.1 hypothetical protein [Enterobacter hormaechei]